MLKLLPFIVALFLTPLIALSQIALQLNWKPEPQFGGFYAADFGKQGLDVKVEAGGAGTPTVQMVAAGRVPYGVVSADELVIARARGLDVVALFAVYQTNPQGIMTRASRGFTEIGQIFSQPGVLAMQKGLPYALFLEQKYGFDKLQVVPSPFGDLTAYRTREAYAMQCFVTSEPLAAVKTGIEPKTFLIADAGYNPYTTVLVTRGDHLRQSEPEVRKIVAAVAEGWRAYLDDPTKTNDRMREMNPSMDAETFRASAEAQRPLIETADTQQMGLGVMTADRWKTLIGQLRDLKVIDKDVDPATCFVDLRPAAASK
jgi:NitT/TauT family transport system substrate-binding protein